MLNYYMSDLELLTKVLNDRFGSVGVVEVYGWPHPHLNVLDCVLSLNRRYDAFVVPRLKKFSQNHPNIAELTQLLELIETYPDPTQFCVSQLNYNDAARAATLVGVIKYLLDIQHDFGGSTENERLRAWAAAARPGDYAFVGVRGFGLAGFQYLRMLFGVQTTKPDVHIIRFVSEVLGKKVNDVTALSLLERAAKQAGLPLREVDNIIWQARSKG